MRSSLVQGGCLSTAAVVGAAAGRSSTQTVEITVAMGDQLGLDAAVDTLIFTLQSAIQ